MIAGDMNEIGIAAQTMFAELVQQALDAEFDEQYDERGNFVRKKVDGPLYWYYQRKVDGRLRQLYVGPVKDEAINQRVKRFNDLKSNFRHRRDMVRALITIGLMPPDAITGLVIESLWKGGFFRLRGVLVGTAAYQCYAGILGVKLPGASLMTQDLDAAQFYDVSHMVGDSMPPILDVLHEVDETFTPIPDANASSRVARFRSRKTGYIVEFLTPNRGSDRNVGKLAEMPALGGASAIPLRYLDFLIHEPIRSVILFKGGVPVTVPSPQRYAVHKLIVAAVRESGTKVGKDLVQASQIIEAVLPHRAIDLYEAWIDAWQRGPKWQASLRRGLGMLDGQLRDKFIFSLQVHGWSQKNPPRRRRKRSALRKTPKRKVLRTSR
jgi:hypothetical protein